MLVCMRVCIHAPACMRVRMEALARACMHASSGLLFCFSMEACACHVPVCVPTTVRAFAGVCRCIFCVLVYAHAQAQDRRCSIPSFRMYTSACVCMCVCVCACVNERACMHTHAHTQVRMDARACDTRRHTNTHTRTHACVQGCSR
jgi:hypothetical protein